MLFLLLFFLIFQEVSSEGYKIDGKSRNIEIDLVDQSFKAEGKSEVSYQDITVQAKEIKKKEDENKILAKGDISFQQGEYQVSAKSLELDLDKKIAKVEDGKTELNDFHLRAKEIEADFPDILKAKDAYVTTCSLDDPHFRIEAKHVDFYPDAKFIAYQGWIYVGKRFKLFPVPIYASYVVDKEDRAPLFPKITYDEAKGTMVIYGFDYEVYKDETILDIPHVNLDFLLNLEYSQNRGLGVNKMKTTYSMLKNKNFKGETQITDWVRAGSEGIDKNFDATYPVSLKPTQTEEDGRKVITKGVSYKFATKNELSIDKGYFVKLKDTHILGPANSKLDLKITNSDLIKDSQGNYRVGKEKEKFTQVDIEVNQKIWKMLDLKYKYLGINTTKTTLENLKKKLDDEIEESFREEVSEVDTKTENHLRLIHDDNLYHKFEYERKRNSDIRPEKGSSGKSKEDRKDMYSLNFRKLRFGIKFEDSFKDIWASKAASLDIEKENYVAEDRSNRHWEITLGEYEIFNSGFTHSYSFDKKNKEDRKFNVPEVSISPEEDYESRDTRVYKREFESFMAAGAKLRHRGIALGNFARIDPSYEARLKKFIDSSKKDNGKYFDSIIHNVNVKAPLFIYDNSKVSSRKVDLRFNVTPGFVMSYFTGEAPTNESFTRPTNDYEYSITNVLNVGNIALNYTFTWNRNFYAKENFLKDNNFNNRGNIKIGSQNIFAFNIAIKNDWEVENSEANYSFSQDYSSDWDKIKLEFKHNYMKRLNRDINDKNIVKIKEEKEKYSGSVDVLGLKGSYDRSFSYRRNIVEIKDLSRIIENKLKIEFKKDFEKEKRKYDAYVQYQNEYDEITSEFKDSTLSCEFILEDRNDIKAKEKVKEIDEEEEASFKSEFFDFTESEDEEIDRILALKDDNNSNRRNIMDLGKEKKKEKVDERLKKARVALKIIHDASQLEEYSWEEYMSAWKIVNLDIFLKYSKYIELEYKVKKKRRDVFRDYDEDTREFDIRLGFGQEDYEWWPGFHMKDNKVDSRIENVYGTLDKNMHCTKMRIKFGQARSSINNEMVWMFGFELSISAFPEKAFGADIREDRVENVKFGL